MQNKDLTALSGAQVSIVTAHKKIKSANADMVLSKTKNCRGKKQSIIDMLREGPAAFTPK